MGLPGGSVVRRSPPTNAGDMGSIPGEGNDSPLAWKILACKIPGTEEPGGLQYMGLQRIGHDTATKQQQTFHGNCLNCIIYHFDLQESS